MIGLPEHYMWDETVLKVFGVTESKMRTAQRFGLIEADIELRESRYVRAWHIDSVRRVYIADLLALHMAIPFRAAVEIMSQAVVKLAIDRSAPRGTSDEPLPLLILTDRTNVSFQIGDDETALGRMARDSSGRYRFRAGDGSFRDGVTISTVLFSPIAAVMLFLEAAKALY